jgi:hypothetical protein
MDDAGYDVHVLGSTRTTSNYSHHAVCMSMRKECEYIGQLDDTMIYMLDY